VACIGAGAASLTAAYFLIKRGADVLLEQDPVLVGARIASDEKRPW